MERKRLRLAQALSLGLIAMSSDRVWGDEITLFNTGVDLAGDVLSGGAFDPHWRVTDGPNITVGAPAEVLNSPSTLYTTTTDSLWVWVEADGRAGVNAPYTFEQTFDLTGLDHTTAEITGAWGVDNLGFIRLNGSTVGIGSGSLSFVSSVVGNFSSLHNFTLDDGFVPGINTLEFVLTDTGNPAGFNVSELTGTADPIPEPASVLLVGLGTLACVRRRRRS